MVTNGKYEYMFVTGMSDCRRRSLAFVEEPYELTWQ